MRPLKGQCPDYVHAPASSVFSLKDRDLLFTFSSHILDFQRSLSSYLKFGWQHKDLSRFYL